MNKMSIPSKEFPENGAYLLLNGELYTDGPPCQYLRQTKKPACSLAFCHYVAQFAEWCPWGSAAILQ